MTSFPTSIRPSVQAELDAAGSAETQGRRYTAFQHLERAHVIGQPSTVEHVRVHWRMFRHTLHNLQPGEAYGQAWRLAATVFTPVGLAPTGTTGGADISGIRRMAIPEDVQAIIDASRSDQRRSAANCICTGTCTGNCTCAGTCSCAGDCSCADTCTCTARNQRPSAHTDISSSPCHCALPSGQDRARGEERSWIAAGATRVEAPVPHCDCANCSCA
ncbi:DUF3703 domain-containing protein [Ramlibacter sp.]|uniref:DUF3703 domain-containing protein n=1 Tax=Ramlibacter sp. TaxID=1917967 RepID=UPI002616FC22|nr:DUF3703 domain-containing protein [Ramlibacter sp.]MDB5955482.1 hypothetical protein [Ramlibacter sp.]